MRLIGTSKSNLPLFADAISTSSFAGPYTITPYLRLLELIRPLFR